MIRFNGLRGPGGGTQQVHPNLGSRNALPELLLISFLGSGGPELDFDVMQRRTGRKPADDYRP